MEVSQVAGPGRPTHEIERQRAYARATQRAKQRLAASHQDEYQSLLEVEKAREGIRTLQPRQVAQ